MHAFIPFNPSSYLKLSDTTYGYLPSFSKAISHNVRAAVVKLLGEQRIQREFGQIHVGYWKGAGLLRPVDI